MKIVVSNNGEHHGPYELNILEEFVEQGAFSLTDMCWQEGWAEWRPLASIISRPSPQASLTTERDVSAVQQNTLQGEIVFSDMLIDITTQHIRTIGDVTYPLNKILTVKIKEDTSGYIAPIFLVLLGIVAAYLANDPIKRLLALVVFFASAVTLARLIGKSYWLVIATTSGEANAIRSSNRDYIEDVVSKINEVIVRSKRSYRILRRI